MRHKSVSLSEYRHRQLLADCLADQISQHRLQVTSTVCRSLLDSSCPLHGGSPNHGQSCAREVRNAVASREEFVLSRVRAYSFPPEKLCLIARIKPQSPKNKHLPICGKNTLATITDILVDSADNLGTRWSNDRDPTPVLSLADDSLVGKDLCVATYNVGHTVIYAYLKHEFGGKLTSYVQQKDGQGIISSTYVLAGRRYHAFIGGVLEFRDATVAFKKLRDKLQDIRVWSEISEIYGIEPLIAPAAEKRNFELGQTWRIQAPDRPNTSARGLS